MFCGKCGENVDDNTKFCPKCGNLISGNDRATQVKPEAQKYKDLVNGNNKNKTVGMIVVAIIGLVVISGAFWLFGGRSYKKTIKEYVNAQFNYSQDSIKSTHNRRERPVCGHRGGSRGPFYYRITTFEGRPWDARDPHKTTFMALKHVIRLSIWWRQKETPGVEKAPGVSSPQRKESGRSGRDDGELRFGVRPGHPRKAVTSISQAEALAHLLAHLHHLVFAAVLARELDWCAALQDAREDARPWGVVGIGLVHDVAVALVGVRVELVVHERVGARDEQNGLPTAHLADFGGVDEVAALDLQVLASA